MCSLHQGDATEDPTDVLSTTRVNYATVRPGITDMNIEGDNMEMIGKRVRENT